MESHGSRYPCALQYDSIVRLETANQDIPLILSKFTDPDGRPNVLASANKMPSVTPEEKLKGLTAFYKDVNITVVHKLLDIYRDDFRLFGYGWDVERASGSIDL